MKNQITRKNVCKLLVVLIILSVVIAFLSNLDLQHVYAATSYSESYLNVDDEQLDLLTNRDTVNSEDPQITVFVHGLGSQAFHWSNDGHNNFTYQQSSMPEQLRLSIRNNNAVLYVVKVGYDLSSYSGYNKVQSEALSVPIDTDDVGVNDGCTEFQGSYTDFKAKNDSGIMLYDCNTKNYPDINNKSSITSLSKADTQKHIILIFDQFSEWLNGDYIWKRK